MFKERLKYIPAIYLIRYSNFKRTDSVEANYVRISNVVKNTDLSVPIGNIRRTDGTRSRRRRPIYICRPILLIVGRSRFSVIARVKTRRRRRRRRWICARTSDNENTHRRPLLDNRAKTVIVSFVRFDPRLT